MNIILLTKTIVLNTRENMPKLMQKIVLFIEPNDDAFLTPAKIGHLFMNRFAIGGYHIRL